MNDIKVCGNGNVVPLVLTSVVVASFMLRLLSLGEGHRDAH